MILIDMNQVMISNLMSQISSNPMAELSESLIRHMVLSSILSYKKKFSEEYGKMVFCADDRKYWRKEIFPYYKANRKKARDASKFDWNLIFGTLNKIRDEIKEKFPYLVIQVEGAEADDIIGTMVKYTQTHELLKTSSLDPDPQKVLIISGDKDFMQLQKYSNVKQFSPMQKKFLLTDNPSKTLLEHILTGDSGDGIPNFLSQDSVFVSENARQKPIRKDKLNLWMSMENPERFCDESMLRNFKRNEQLINLDFTPYEIQRKIIETYEAGPVGDRKNLLNYFVENRLKYLLESISEF
ncbi:RnaseH [uncultured Caudovirales phage]|uniref:RnaseH n=1 Tax=uncultured Caudovirales phage TaxID=2100421 RepID=A0A6J5M3R7_9CAUD|nr:RnaseH [uncultured Caudovirales phage]